VTERLNDHAGDDQRLSADPICERPGNDLTYPQMTE
jgi:hypothetical protein